MTVSLDKKSTMASFNRAAGTYDTHDFLQREVGSRVLQQLDMLVHPNHALWDREISTDDAEARCSAYLELQGGVADTFVLSYLSDILPPVVQNKYGPLGWVPTLALTCNIRQLPQTNQLFIDGLAKDISNGYFEQDCNIWDMNGNLVATSRQLAKILKSEEKISS